jgi:hypothetical protein
VTSKIDNYTSSAISGTAGITYHNKKRKEGPLLVMRNFGFQLKSFNGEEKIFPSELILDTRKSSKTSLWPHHYGTRPSEV